MDDTLKLTDSYWEMLKSLSDEVKLRLATRLTASVVAAKAINADTTEEMLKKHMGVWKDDRTTEQIIEDMYAGRQNTKAPLNFD
ncbi:hypothetical protein [Bacteroides caecimuris]|uniref:hypothetical protein n=1 Tax=Bacteroides caecimuris TaxID=1796613 RepID=UPI001C3C5DA3|nr:hypothetical protein [Bacteroides caecimuris]